MPAYLYNGIHILFVCVHACIRSGDVLEVNKEAVLKDLSSHSPKCHSGNF